MNTESRDMSYAAAGAWEPAVVPGAEGDFAGRAQELAAIGQCRAEAVAGAPWVVVIEGEPGIGKTALARRALAAGPDGMRVCWCTCDLFEQDYPYGVVEQLLRRLPATKSGIGEPVAAPTGSPLAVGADLLAALAVAAESGALAVVIDDIPWADDESLKALSFVLRRLYSEPVLTVLTARIHDAETSDGVAAAAGDWHTVVRGAARVLPLKLTGLSVEETAQMIAVAGAGTLSRQAVDRLWEHTAGHPLYLRSLLGEAGPGALADLAVPLPVPSTLDELVRHILDRLPAQARRLTEALAVLDAATPLATAARLAGLSDAAAALDAALAGGLVQWQPDEPTTPLRMHHQLQRDAVYQAITPSRRHALHAAAATLVGPDRAWDHRVAAAVTTDPELAGRLADEATRQAGEGRHHRAATLQLWAADLAPTREQHEHHLITAVTHLLASWAIARARTLHPALEHCAPSPARDAALGSLAGLGGDLGAAERLLAPLTASAGDLATRLRAATWLGVMHLLRADGPRAVAVLRPVVDRMPPSPATYEVYGDLAWAVGYADGAPAGLAVMAETGLPEHADRVAHKDSFLLNHRGGLRVLAGQLGAGVDDLATLAARMRADGNLAVTPSVHYMLGFGRYLTGQWPDAAISAGHALLVADTLALPYGLAAGHTVAAMVHAQQGHRGQAETDLAACREAAALFPERNCIFPVLATAVLAQAHADRPAIREAIRLLDDPNAITPGARTALLVLWAPLYIEALTAPDHRPTADDLRHAEDALHAFDRLAEHVPALTATSHWLHGRLATAHGDTHTALHHYREGLATPARDGDDIPLHRAFLHHHLARHLQATGRPDEAAHHLQQAHHTYTTLGATPHARRAAHDLAPLHPAGIPADVPGPADTLTEREHEVAHLASRGLTNQEIARELFVSPKTVEYHLGNVYTKLHLTGRRQLRTALQSAAVGG
ncbi:LuxR C-terminal-related transcriptional regulator [Streptomyces sp. NBC_01017]|uniref:helix-turn-helix transcriptional regulator n=1 Tax=Streptomyces sp. NBC_01017 TaxID=2903721 RepID=UPI0038687C9B|nr:LuxR C-terminal-related transcriptional regulator [Streptomyces sp. NBC_01017]WSV34986.1 LuxR C-terminal-related transcriptional regulator [Streptomyces sp. NBC_01017]